MENRLGAVRILQVRRALPGSLHRKCNLLRTQLDHYGMTVAKFGHELGVVLNEPPEPGYLNDPALN